MSWRTRCKPCGLSLIELLAATAIIGLMLAGVLQIRSDAIRRAADARAAAEALTRLDALLTEWEAAGWPNSVAIGASGDLGARMRWRIDEVEPQKLGRDTRAHDRMHIASVTAFRLSSDTTAPPLARLWVFLPSAEGPAPTTSADR